MDRPGATLTLTRAPTPERGCVGAPGRGRLAACLATRAFRWCVPVPSIMELSDPRWGEFVERHPAATPFHHPYWARLVADCYGFPTFVLAASDPSGVVPSGLPLVEVRHLHGGRTWVSLPYTDYCPPLASARTWES